MRDPLDTGELATLLVRLEQAVAETAGRFKVQMALVAGLFVLMGIGLGVQGVWAVSAFVWAFAGFIGYIGYRAGKRTSPEKMRPVVDAVRDAPEKITVVRHYETSDSARVFVTHWLSIATAEHQLLLKAPDWELLLGYLERRCPDAKLILQ